MNIYECSDTDGVYYIVGALDRDEAFDYVNTYLAEVDNAGCCYSASLISPSTYSRKIGNRYPVDAFATYQELLDDYGSGVLCCSEA